MIEGTATLQTDRRGLRVMVFIKQIPAFESFRLEENGRLQRSGVPLEMSAYCRRAVAKGVELARTSGGHCTVATLGPPSAEQVLLEALAWGADQGVLLSDAVFAGSDTLVTARALAALSVREGPFDLVLVGRSSLDAETGQVGPELAELLGLGFAGPVRELEIDQARETIWVRCEEDDGGSERIVQLPCVLAVAERLCAPAKVPPEEWPRVESTQLKLLGADDLAVDGPWGHAASPTSVNAQRSVMSTRDAWISSGPIDEQVDAAVSRLIKRGALENSQVSSPPAVPAQRRYEPGQSPTPIVAVLLEHDREQLARELLGSAASVAAATGARVIAFVTTPYVIAELSSWGADALIEYAGGHSEESVAVALTKWAVEWSPEVLIAPSTTWGREVASRVAARMGAGLIGDALEIEVIEGRLVAMKPAFGGEVLAEVVSSSRLQIVTVRPGVLALKIPRQTNQTIELSHLTLEQNHRVRVVKRWRDDDLETLSRAEVVIGIGAGVAPDDYELIHRLARLLGGEVAATRKVTDRGWMPHSRQVGITGRSISPRLYVAIGLSGKFNHLSGVRDSGTILAVNINAEAPVFENCDIGIVGDWREIVPMLIARVAHHHQSVLAGVGDSTKPA
ncbi:MAG: hypothetical protein HKL86_06520 [Acidimicrobiaceae bacterium]|nr:hypothetical protein [Acidimicrobiaceae bacterium]